MFNVSDGEYKRDVLVFVNNKSICKYKIYLPDGEIINNVRNKLIIKITQIKSVISGMGLYWIFKEFLIKKEFEINLFLSRGN